MATGRLVQPRDGCILLIHKENSNESSAPPLSSKSRVKTCSFCDGEILVL